MNCLNYERITKNDRTKPFEAYEEVLIIEDYHGSIEITLQSLKTKLK